MESASLTTNTTSTSTSTSTVTSELFICFTSRLSSSTSSSMKISSKSILSPGRARDSSQISLSSSLSRRLKTSGSLKGGQASPMFPAGSGSNNKKRSGVAFENPEPSSPKVTCIGQVRVKTKKQGKKMRSSYNNRSSKRRSNGGGEASFRRTAEEEVKEKKTIGSKNANESDSNCNSNNQKSFTICEALRAFGAELNCFLPCRSSCTTTASEKENDNKLEKRTASSNSNNGRSCGAVFARWLVALQDGDGKGREIELVVGGDEEQQEEEDRQERSCGGRRSLRRRAFEGIEFKEEEIMKSTSFKDSSGVNGEGEEEEEKGRVSICIPPKNALLLMRCRSDPVKMAALANRFWDLPPPKDDNDEDEEEENQDVKEDVELKINQSEMCEKKCASSASSENEELGENGEQAEEEKKLLQEEFVEEVVAEEVLEDEQEKEEENTERISTEVVCTRHEAEQEEEEEDNEPEYEAVLLEQQEEEENSGDVKEEVEESEKKQEEMLVIQLAPEPEAVIDLEKDEEVIELHCEEEQKIEEQKEKPESVKCEDQEDEEEEEEKVVGDSTEEEEQEEAMTQPETTQEEKTGREDPKERTAAAVTSPGLPECLLLMMCEPKLSMEVSKETWVCSTDFIRWLPERRRVNPKKAALEDEPKKRLNTTTTAAVDGPLDNKSAQFMLQPPRSSCSFPVTAAAAAPAAQSMASVIEQKLVGTKPGYEPFVLTRCKSEPMRSAVKLAPEACFWKNRKLEPHRPTTLGVGAAGFGF